MPLKILVVDDDPGTLAAISDYLYLCGYSVITVNNGQEALEQVEISRPDLMVTDIVMPVMNGYELVRQVRQKPTLRLLPVILLTARAKTEERILGYQSGCDLYLPKPFELEELGAAISNLLERSRIIQSEYLVFHAQNTNPSTQKGIDNYSSNDRIDSGLFAELSPREQEVLELLTHGLSNVEIGHKLHLSPRTVEKYVSSLLRKSSTSNRAELVRFAMKHGLVE
ncbi:response regulator transcription factor [Calothrix sp. 336/3]|uniref:response regulator transcription factor n=1 Tax=Calothrix sp. 336/3 TaxID=1337936 RepID=UPI0004E35BB7|nr:response regulator transcription factor [Calothrix sp. 336/3]AKG22228.1 chemotaxis protein CheY [Calothrix sp. 336/3]